MIESVNVSRESLITRLEEKVAEAKRKRDEEAKKATEKLDELLPALSGFERRYLADTIRNLRKNGTWDPDPADRESTGWKSAPDENPEQGEFNPEAEYERLIRALQMSGDETINLEPDTDVYNMI